MTSDAVSIDFRSHAIVASEELLRDSGGFLRTQGGVSFCLQREPSHSRLRPLIIAVTIICFVLFLSGLLAGGLIAALPWKKLFGDSTTISLIAVSCTVGAILVGFTPAFFERFLVHRYLARRDDIFGIHSTLPGIHVALEDAATCGQMKLLAEDVGLVFIDPVAHCVRIDGLSCDYLIQSRDIVRLSLHSDQKSVYLSYKIGEELLEILIRPRSIWAEFKRQTIGSSKSLFANMKDALDLQL